MVVCLVLDECVRGGCMQGLARVYRVRAAEMMIGVGPWMLSGVVHEHGRGVLGVG